MELLESDVMWPEDEEMGCEMASQRPEEPESSIAISRRQKGTAAMCIPAAPAHFPIEDLDSESDTEEMVPPHMMVSRRRSSASLAFSLTSCPGRTLKGRDLAHVRIAVLRMTGFLEKV